MACFELGIEDLEALGVPVGDDDGLAGEGADLVVAIAEGVDELEFHLI